jgi:hypothetical protein
MLKIDPNKLAAADLAAIWVFRDMKVLQAARQQSDVLAARLTVRPTGTISVWARRT